MKSISIIVSFAFIFLINIAYADDLLTTSKPVGPVISLDTNTSTSSTITSPSAPTDFFTASTLSPATVNPDFNGITSGDSVSGTVNIGPNLSSHADIRKVAYYFDGSKSGKVYSSPFYWGGLNGTGIAGFDTTTTTNGNHTLAMTYTDTIGDHTTSVDFTVNNIGAIQPKLTGVAAGDTVSGTITVGPDLATFGAIQSAEYFVDNVSQSISTTSPFVWGDSLGFDTKTISNSTHTFKAVVTDNTGPHEINLSVTVNNQIITPGVDFTGVTNGATLNGIINIGPNLAAHPSIQKAAYYLNGTKSGKVYSSPFYWGGLSGTGTAGFDTNTLFDGNYTLGMIYTDSTGDHSVSVSFIVSNAVPDTTAPVLSAVAVSNVASTGATISWTTDEASDSQVEYRIQGTAIWSATSINTVLVINHSVLLAGLNASTAYEYQVKSKDQAGNLATQATVSTFTTATPDTTAPLISTVTSTNIISTGATINWNTDEVSDSQVEFRVQGTTTWSATSVNVSLVTSHSISLVGLNPSTAYEFQVKSKDQAGNLATQTTISGFTTTAPVTGDFAGVPEGATVKGVVNINPNFTLHPDVRKVAYYLNGTQSGKVYSSPFYWGGINGNGTAGFDTTTLSDGNFTLSMVYTDGTGDHGASISFIVNNTSDGTLFPVISAIDSIGVTAAKATIIWTTNEPSDSQVEYRVQATTPWTATTVNSSLTLNHWVELNGLTASTAYEYRVKSKDPDGYLTTSATISSFATLQPSADTTPPKISNVTSTSITSTGATVNWFTDESSDSRLRYRAQGASTWIMSKLNPPLVTGHSVIITGLTAATVYEVQVFSQDSSGNLVAQETISHLTTADLTSPANLTGIANGDTLTGVVTISPLISAFGTIQKTEYYVDGISRGVSTTSPFTWGDATGFASRLLANTPHAFKVVVTDNTGNHEINLNFTAYNTDIPPSTDFVGITPGATVSGIINIGVNLSTHPDIRKVAYYLDFTQSGKTFVSPYLWGGTAGTGTTGFDTHSISNIPHILIMFYTDNTGDHEGRIDFIVNN